MLEINISNYAYNYENLNVGTIKVDKLNINIPELNNHIIKD